MNKLDRVSGPPSGRIGKVGLSFPGLTKFANGTELFCYHDPASEIVKIEFRFDAGRYYNSVGLQSTLTSALIMAGTRRLTSAQIAEKIDFYGAYLKKDAGADYASVSVYSLRKYVVEVLKIISEAMREAAFPEDELRTALSIRKQRFLISREKVDFMARVEFNALLFGEAHPYGKKTALGDFDAITREDLIEFYSTCYKKGVTIFVSGNAGEDLFKELESEFSWIEGRTIIKEADNQVNKLLHKGRKVIEKKTAVQSALRIGCQTFNRSHPDYPDMQVLTTVLGGYFGSRLMSNLREDKGYTYGIGSGMASMGHGGYFYISGEVGSSVTRAAETEIFAEMNALCDSPVPLEELDTVRNYMSGQILRSTDGVFASMDRFKGFQAYGLGEADFDNWVESIMSIEPPRLAGLASRWLDRDNMTVVIAGRDT